MNDAALAVTQVRAEQRSFWRNPAAAGFTVVFPLMLLVIFGHGGDIVMVDGVAVRFQELFIPAIVAFGTVAACFTNIAMSVSIRRDAGILKRLRGTPLPPLIFMAGVVGSSLIISLLLSTVTVVFGLVVYQTHFPQHPLELVLAMALAAFALCSLGLAMTALIPSADSAPAIVNLVVLPTLFVSGVFGPGFTGTIKDLIDVLPVSHFLGLLQRAFDPAHLYAQPLLLGDVGHLLVWGVIGLILAVRFFRWEPRKN